MNGTFLPAHLEPQLLQPVPQALRQGCGGIEQQIEALEEFPPQRLVALQVIQQRRKAARHVEIEGGRHLLQVGDRAADQRRHRLALVDVERAAVAQHHVEIVVAAEGVVPRQPVDQHRRVVLEECPGRRRALLVGAQHALGVDHALGLAGGAGGEQDLGQRVGPDAGERLLHRRRRPHLGEGRERRHSRGAEAAAAGDDLEPRRADRLQRLGVAVGLVDVDEARLDQAEDVAELAEVLRQPRVGRRHRHHGDADVHGAERDQRMVDAVLGQDQQRAARARACGRERLSDGIGRARCLLVGDAPPAACGVALGQEDAIGLAAGPALQQHAERARHGRQRTRRAQHDGAVGLALVPDVGRREQLTRRQRRRLLHSTLPHEPPPSFPLLAPSCFLS